MLAFCQKIGHSQQFETYKYNAFDEQEVKYKYATLTHNS